MVSTSSNFQHPSQAWLAEFCRRWSLREIAVFGSCARGDMTPASDVDVLIWFTEQASPSLYDLATMQQELEASFGRRVDLLSRSAVERSTNPYRRRAILESAKVLYAA